MFSFFQFSKHTALFTAIFVCNCFLAILSDRGSSRSESHGSQCAGGCQTYEHISLRTVCRGAGEAYKRGMSKGVKHGSMFTYSLIYCTFAFQDTQPLFVSMVRTFSNWFNLPVYKQYFVPVSWKLFSSSFSWKKTIYNKHMPMQTLKQTDRHNITFNHIQTGNMVLILSIDLNLIICISKTLGSNVANKIYIIDWRGRHWFRAQDWLGAWQLSKKPFPNGSFTKSWNPARHHLLSQRQWGKSRYMTKKQLFTSILKMYLGLSCH